MSNFDETYELRRSEALKDSSLIPTVTPYDANSEWRAAYIQGFAWGVRHGSKLFSDVADHLTIPDSMRSPSVAAKSLGEMAGITLGTRIRLGILKSMPNRFDGKENETG